MKTFTYIHIFFLIFYASMIGAEVNNLNQIHYQIFGAGKTVIAVHGGPGMDSTYFLPYLKSISKFAKLVVYDQRGCGKSKMPLNYLPTFDDYINDIELLRRKLNSRKITLIGHSFGAIIALKYLIKYKENIDKIIIISGYARKHPMQYKYFKFPKKMYNRIISIQKSALNNAKKHRLINKIKFKLYFHKSKFKNNSFINKLYDKINFNKNVFKHFTSNSSYLTFDVRNELQNLNISKSLIIVGKYDIITPPFLSKELSQHLNSKLIIFNNSGHFPFIEENKKFIKIVKNYILN